MDKKEWESSIKIVFHKFFKIELVKPPKRSWKIERFVGGKYTMEEGYVTWTYNSLVIFGYIEFQFSFISHEEGKPAVTI